MNSWTNILKTALLGTARKQLTPASLKELKAMGVSVEDSESKIILESASIFSLLNKSGYALPKIQPDDSALAGKESLPPCSRKSARHLGLILGGMYTEALPEFLYHLAKVGKRLPEDRLPEIFQICKNKQELILVRETMGARGEWLVKQNSDWSYLNVLSDPSLWDLSIKKDRIHLLRNIRAVDPETALHLLNNNWKKETYQSKIAYIKCLEIGLSISDQTFLETCLDDGRKEVRKEAARVLSLLPDSALVKRMFERGIHFIQIKKSGLRKKKLEIQLPQRCDDAMIRDGIDPRSQWFRGGVKAGRLGQIVAAIPPSNWEKHFEIKPAKFLDMIAESDWSELLVQALLEATQKYKDENWSAALIDFWEKTQYNSSWGEINILPLLESASDKLFNQFCINSLVQEDGLLEENHPAAVMMKSGSQPWSEKLTNAFLKNFRSWLNSETTRYWNGWHYRGILKNAGYKSSPKLYQKIKDDWPRGSRIWGSWEKDVEQFLNALQFRAAMIEELGKED